MVFPAKKGQQGKVIVLYYFIAEGHGGVNSHRAFVLGTLVTLVATLYGCADFKKCKEYIYSCVFFLSLSF